MNWIEIDSEEQLEQIIEGSKKEPILIFKHSTRCATSSMAINRLERNWTNDAPIKPYYLDLIRYRDISNAIAAKFEIMHQSPQVILIKDGKAIYHNSHLGISFDEIQGQIKN